MAHTTADVLEVHHHDDTITTYQGVAYTPWSNSSRSGVTVFDLDGGQLAQHEDIRTTVAHSDHR